MLSRERETKRDPFAPKSPLAFIKQKEGGDLDRNGSKFCHELNHTFTQIYSETNERALINSLEVRMRVD